MSRAPRRREIDVRHDRQRELLGHLDRELQRADAVALAGVAPDPHLDADDQVAMLLGDLQAGGTEQAHVAHSPTMTDLENAKMPANEMLR